MEKEKDLEFYLEWISKYFKIEKIINKNNYGFSLIAQRISIHVKELTSFHIYKGIFSDMATTDCPDKEEDKSVDDTENSRKCFIKVYYYYPPFHAEEFGLSIGSFLDSVPECYGAYEFKNEKHTFYMIEMEYFENAIPFVPKSIQDLKQRLSEASKILQHFHEHGIVHNDLKPEHFLIYQNRLVLIDFDLSENIYLTHSKRHNFGTIPFTAPERYDPPKSITKKSDVWSMGIILLLWMTNQPLDYFISISKDSIQKKDGIIIYSETFRNEISKFLNHISDSCKKQDFQGPFWDPDLFNLCIEMLNPNPKLRPIFSFSKYLK